MCMLLYKVVIMLYLKVFLMHTRTRLKECKLEPHYNYVSFLEHGRIEFFGVYLPTENFDSKKFGTCH